MEAYIDTIIIFFGLSLLFKKVIEMEKRIEELELSRNTASQSEAVEI